MIKLTPKGKRWGDVMRDCLSDPEHEVSRAVRNRNAWWRITKNNSRDYKWELGLMGGLYIEKIGPRGTINEQEPMSYFPDVSLWYPI